MGAKAHRKKFSVIRPKPFKYVFAAVQEGLDALPKALKAAVARPFYLAKSANKLKRHSRANVFLGLKVRQICQKKTDMPKRDGTPRPTKPFKDVRKKMADVCEPSSRAKHIKKRRVRQVAAKYVGKRLTFHFCPPNKHRTYKIYFWLYHPRRHRVVKLRRHPTQQPEIFL